MPDSKVALLHVFNILDAAITTHVVYCLGVEEANPIMALLIERGPIVFLLVKCVVGVVAITFLDKVLARSARRRMVFSMLLGVYTLVLLWHLVGLVGFFSFS